jgi:hypothetical protein
MAGEQYGHIKMSRRAYDTDPLWLKRREYSEWEAWEDIIQYAAWRTYKRLVGATIVELHRGEFLGSIRFLAQRWMWTDKRVRWFLNKTIADRIRVMRESEKGHIYLIVNYDAYQTQGHTRGAGGAHEGHEVEAVKQISKKDSVSEADVLFEVAWETYPRRANNPKKSAKTAWDTRIKEGIEARDLLAAVDRYAAYCKAAKVAPRYVMMGSTFFGPNERWKDSFEIEDQHGRRRDGAGGADQGAGGPKRGKYDHLTVVSGAEPAA